MRALLNFFRTGPAAPPIEDRAEVDRRYRRYRTSTIIAITIGYASAYTCRLSLAAVKAPLIKDLELFSAEQMGHIGSAFFYTYAVAKLTNGFLADHANLRRFFSFALLMTALVNLLMGTAPMFALWIGLWGLNGYFQGFGAPTGAVTLARWFSNNERGLYYGVFSSAHSIGEGLSFGLLPILIVTLGWQAGFWTPAFLCTLMSVGVLFALQDRPQCHGLPPVAEWKGERVDTDTRSETSERASLREQLSILRLRPIWILGMASALMYVTRYAINSWGMFYLETAKGFTRIESGGLLVANTLAGICGSLTLGVISDRVFKGRRPPAILIFGVVQLVALWVVLFAPTSSGLVLTLALLCFGFALAGLLAALGGLFAIDIAPKRAAGAAMGFIGVFSYIGAGIQENISGYLIERGTTVVDGVKHFDFGAASLFWFGASVLSLLLAATLWKVRPRD